MLRSKGWSISAIAQALRKSEFSITRHIDDYLKKEKLKPESGGIKSYLNDAQTEQLIQHISEYIPKGFRNATSILSENSVRSEDGRKVRIKIRFYEANSELFNE